MTQYITYLKRLIGDRADYVVLLSCDEKGRPDGRYSQVWMVPGTWVETELEW